MKATIATVTLASLAPLTQSRKHDDPKLEGENAEDYDRRTWRSHLHIEKVGPEKLSVVIPAAALHQCITAAAKYTGEQIKGQGKKTWTAKFAGGLMFTGNPSLDIDPETVEPIVINAHADGNRTSGKRVTRRFPQMPQWETTFEVYIVDPIITRDVFERMIETAGMFIGIGQFRPEKLGHNGRFRLKKLDWQDNRQIVG